MTASSLALSLMVMPAFAAEVTESAAETEESGPTVYTVVFYNQDEEPVAREFEEGYVLTDEDFPTVAIQDDEEFEGWFDCDTDEEIKAGTVISSDMYVIADWDHYLTVALFDNVNGSDPLFYDVLTGTSVLDILPESEDGTHYTDREGRLITEDSVIGNTDMTIYLNACDYHTHVGNKDGVGVVTRTCRTCGYTYTENTDITDGLAVYRESDFYQQNAVISDEGDQTVQYPVSNEEYEVLAGDWNGDGWDTLAVCRDGNSYLFQEYITDELSFLSTRYGHKSDEVVVGRWS